MAYGSIFEVMMCLSKKSGHTQRLLALSLSFLLLSGIGVDAYALDPCSHHNPGMQSGDTVGNAAHAGGGPDAGADDAHADDAHAGHGTQAASAQAAGAQAAGAHGADAHAGAADAGHGSAHGDACTCMGECTAAAAIPVPHTPAMPEGRAHDVVAPIVTSSPDATASLHLALLPYSIAPPAAPSSIQA